MLGYLLISLTITFGYGRKIGDRNVPEGIVMENSFNLHRINEGVRVNGKELFQGDIVHDDTVEHVISKRRKRGTFQTMLSFGLWFGKLNECNTIIQNP